MIDPSVVLEDLRDFLVTVTGLATGNNRAPGGNQADPDPPYLVVRPLGTRRPPEVPFAFPDADQIVAVQVHGVGTSERQAGRAGQRAYEAILARTAGGAFLHPWPEAEGYKVAGRLPVSIANSVTEGDTINRVDQFELYLTTA